MPDPLPRAKDAAELRADVTLKFPFLEYSVYNILHHANYAQHNMIDQKDFLVDFSLPRWIFINNLFEKHDIRRYSKSASSLYILAERNLTELIQNHPQKESCFNVEKERYGVPFFAAVATNSEESINTLLKIKTETQPETSPLHSLYHSYCQNKAGRLKLGRDFVFPKKGDVISCVAEHGDNILLNFILESEPDQHLLNSKGREGMTPLSRAIIDGPESVVRVLIEKGAEINFKDNYGRTPLLWAAIGDHESIARLLIEKGAEVNSKDDRSRTPLSLAATGSFESVVRLLIEKGAEVNSRDYSGRTSLSMAATGSFEEVVRLLIEKGAEVNSRDIYGGTPLSLAVEGMNEFMVALLINCGADTNQRDDLGQTPLSLATTRGKHDVIQLLLSHGAKVDSMDVGGRTPEWWAVNYGHEKTMELLLNYGTDIGSYIK